MSLRARVAHGRLILDVPTSLPDGAFVDLVSRYTHDAEDELPEALEAALVQGAGEIDRGECVTLEELMRSTRPGWEPSERPEPVTSAFDIWVSDNNPDDGLQYGKGFLDYVEIVRRMIDKFDADDARVVGTYIVHTPPPEEELRMPAVAFRVRGVTVALRFDFGAMADWPFEWTVSVVRRSPYFGPVFGLVDPERDLSRSPIVGFPPELFKPSAVRNNWLP